MGSAKRYCEARAVPLAGPLGAAKGAAPAKQTELIEKGPLSAFWSKASPCQTASPKATIVPGRRTPPLTRARADLEGTN